MAQTTLTKFTDAITLHELEANIYKVNFDPQYCVGAVPNGGYTASCIAAAAAKHASKRGQPDLVTAHYEFPDRSVVGPAIIVIDDVKKGRMFSTLHATIWQGELLDSAPWYNPKKCRRPVLAYLIHADKSTFPSELTLPTAYQSHAELTDTVPPLPDFARLRRDGSDDNWTKSVPPKDWSQQAASLLSKVMYVPREGVFTPGVLDTWVRLDTGERLTHQMLPYVVDFLPYEMDRYAVHPELRKAMAAAMEDKSRQQQANAAKKGKSEGMGQAMWMATLSLDIETKEKLPEGGVDWLHLRLLSKHAAGGKFDQSMEVRDEDGNLIVIAHAVSMALSFERNTQKPRAAL